MEAKLSDLKPKRIFSLKSPKLPFFSAAFFGTLTLILFCLTLLVKPPRTPEVFEVYQGVNLLTNPSFETGDTSGWSRSDDINPQEFYAVDCQLYNTCGSVPNGGRYNLKMARQDNGVEPLDPWVVSDWVETSQNLTGRTFTLSFWAKSHEADKTIPLGLQRYPKDGTDWTGTYITLGPFTFVPSGWTHFEQTITFPDAGNGSATSQIRVVLRPPNDNWPVYYDEISLTETTGTSPSPGVSPSPSPESGQGYIFKVKGPEHRQLMFAGIDINPGGNIFDLGSRPLEFGDVDQNGSAGVNDWSAIIACRNANANIGDAIWQSSNCQSADGNFDGQINNFDIDLLYKTMSGDPDDE